MVTYRVDVGVDPGLLVDVMYPLVPEVGVFRELVIHRTIESRFLLEINTECEFRTMNSVV